MDKDAVKGYVIIVIGIITAAAIGKAFGRNEYLQFRSEGLQSGCVYYHPETGQLVWRKVEGER